MKPYERTYTIEIETETNRIFKSVTLSVFDFEIVCSMLHHSHTQNSSYIQDCLLQNRLETERGEERKTKTKRLIEMVFFRAKS